MIITFLKYTLKRDLTKKVCGTKVIGTQESRYFSHVESGILDRLVSKIPTTNRILNPLWYRLCRFHDLESAWHCTLNGRDIYKSWKNSSWVIKFSNSWSNIQKLFHNFLITRLYAGKVLSSCQKNCFIVFGIWSFKHSKDPFMSFLPSQIRHSFEYWVALPELVYWAQKKIIITK